MVSTEPKGQKLKISELISKLIQNNECNIKTKRPSAKCSYIYYVVFLTNGKYLLPKTDSGKRKFRIEFQ